MFKSIKTIMMSTLFSVSAVAHPYNHAEIDLNKTLRKYDYLLTSHPMAHDKGFKASTLVQMKKEIQTVVKSYSKEELRQSFNELIMQIPQKETREAYLRVLETSSQEDFAIFLSKPELMGDALQGEGANFSLTTGNVALDTSIFLVSAIAFIYLANELFVTERNDEREIYMDTDQ